MQARTTTQSAYRCDTDLLIREVLQAAEELFARTAREACTVIVHPLDGHALITTPIGKYGPLVYIGPDGRPRFRNMVILHDHGLPPGMARVEVCDGCLSMWRSCENDTRRGADLEGAARLVVDASTGRGGEQQGTSAPQSAAPREPEAPPAPAARRTRRASAQELERRAKTAARKAAEAAERAEQARRLLEAARGDRPAGEG